MSSGRHRKPESDALPDVDIAERLSQGPVIDSPRHEAPTSRTPYAGAPAAPAGSAGAVAGRTVTARRDRAAERAARRRESRRRQLQVAVLVVAVLAVVGGGALLLSLRGGDDETDAATAPVKQETLLVQVAGADGTAAATALLGVTAGQPRAAAILVPSRLIVDVAGSGTVPFGETLTLADEKASADALTDLLGVRVDGRWVLSTAGLTALVDAVDGVQATVDVDVTTRNAEGTETVVVRAGPQKLDGAAAAAYATFLAADEPEQARMARFNEVLTGVLAGLPDDRAETAKVLEALGDESRSGLEPGALAEVLSTAHAAAGRENLSSDVLPVNELDTGSDLLSYGVNAGQAADLLRSRLPGALQRDPAGQSVRVLVENGVGTPGLVEKARQRLVDDGFRFVNGGNAASFDSVESLVLIPDGTSKSQERGQRVAESLGLPDDAVDVSTRGQTVAEVIVILGRDFKP
ncbi:MAG: LCP family protein [Actinomycetes bacterium]